MTEYKVIIESSAADDLVEISDYITRALNEPGAAAELYYTITDCLLSLSELPKRQKVISDEPYRSMGIRSMYVKNYIVFYSVNDETAAVHIIRILYNRRDWQNII